MRRTADIADALGDVVTAPAYVCLAEVVIPPTRNLFYVGGEDLRRRA